MLNHQFWRWFPKSGDDFENRAVSFTEIRSLILEFAIAFTSENEDGLSCNIITYFDEFEQNIYILDYVFNDSRPEYLMAFEQLKIEIAMLFEEMENQPENKWELHERLREKLDELRSLGMPLPQDLVDLEKTLNEALADQSNK